MRSTTDDDDDDDDDRESGVGDASWYRRERAERTGVARVTTTVVDAWSSSSSVVASGPCVNRRWIFEIFEFRDSSSSSSSSGRRVVDRFDSSDDA